MQAKQMLVLSSATILSSVYSIPDYTIDACDLKCDTYMDILILYMHMKYMAYMCSSADISGTYMPI